LSQPRETQIAATDIRGRQDITRAWIESLLGRAFESITVSSLGENRGFSGELARVALTPPAPASLVVKLPSQVPEIRQMMRQMGLYQRDRLFLESLAPHAPLTIPRLLASCGPAAEPVLLLEDLRHGRPGDQSRGIDPAKARPIFEDLAGFHAHFWQSSGANSLPDWLPDFDQGPDISAFYHTSWPEFYRRFGHQLPDWLRGLAPRAGPALASLRRDLSRGPTTLLHGDLRLDNLLFFDEGGWALLDWQTVVKGRSAFDLAYLSAGNFRHHAPAALAALFDAYASSLEKHGIEDYPLETIRQDYRRSITFLWARTVIAGARLGFERGPAFERFGLALTRWCDAAQQAQVADLLEA
jgi:hypothetical protein